MTVAVKQKSAKKCVSRSEESGVKIKYLNIFNYSLLHAN